MHCPSQRRATPLHQLPCSNQTTTFCFIHSIKLLPDFAACLNRLKDDMMHLHLARRLEKAHQSGADAF